MAGDAVGHIAEAATNGVELFPVVVMLAAGVIAVPLFKRLGLGSVLGYLAAGLALGPSGLAVGCASGSSLPSTGSKAMPWPFSLA